MVSRLVKITGVLMVTLILSSVHVVAEEGTKTMRSTTTTTTTASTAPMTSTTSDTSVTTPATTPSAVTPIPALKPIVITFSGDVSAMDAKGMTITFKDRYGVTKEISVTVDTKISTGGVSKTLDGVKVGEKGTVEYTYDVATGKRTAQNINLNEPAAAPAAGN